jgi:crotonobetainyl-CoA:carnitine CoA-transferase CaiB-like acyl-CoA transferase
MWKGLGMSGSIVGCYNPRRILPGGKNVAEAERIFAGLKVLDIATFIAGPAAATVLADFGADVVKIEPPGSGDPWRGGGARTGMPESPHNYPWTLDGRNRRSIAVDLKRAEGRRVLHRLAKAADILITNLMPAARERLGLDHCTLAALNPRLIYASFTGFGEVGPERDTPGFDTTAWWARSGLMERVRPDAASPPAGSVPGMGDHPSALALVAAILAALYRREKTGEGAYVRSSLLANGAWANGVYVQAALAGARFPERPPRQQARSACHNYYRCADGRWLLLNFSATQEETRWARFAAVIGRPELARDPRFSGMAERRQHAAALIAALDLAFAEQPAAEWQRRLGDAGFSVAPIATMAEVAADAQMEASGVFVPMPGAGGRDLTVTTPLWIEGVEKVAPCPPPALGAHTDEVLKEAGFSAAEIAALRERGAVA